MNLTQKLLSVSRTREGIQIQKTPTKYDHTLPKHHREASEAVPRLQNLKREGREGACPIYPYRCKLHFSTPAAKRMREKCRKPDLFNQIENAHQKSQFPLKMQNRLWRYFIFVSDEICTCVLYHTQAAFSFS